MRKISIEISLRNLIFVGGIILIIFLIIHFMNRSVQSATITWADPNQVNMVTTERSIKYSYDNLSKVENITSVSKLEAEIVKIDQDIKNIKEGAASQILGLQAQKQRRINMLKQIETVLGIVDIITP